MAWDGPQGPRAMGGGMRNPVSGILTILVAVLSLAAGARWHQGALAAPDRIEVSEGPALLLVLRSDDCPDRRAGLERWLSDLGVDIPLRPPGVPWDRPARGGRQEGKVPGLGLRVVHLSGSPGFLGWPPGEGLPTRVRPVDADLGRRASRALKRAGVRGTPAFLLLDGQGRVMLGEEVTNEGPGPRLALAGRLIPGLVSPPEPTHSPSPGEEEGCRGRPGDADESCPAGEAWSS